MSRQTKIGRHATTVSIDHGITQVTYHSTVVVGFGASGIELNSGGWRTATTKTRMNQASNQFALGYRVFQKDFEWFVDYNNKIVPFYDGMVLRRS